MRPNIILRRVLRVTTLNIDPLACLFCQHRSFHNAYRQLAGKGALSTPSAQSPKPPSTLDNAPRAHGLAVSEFTPKPLDRPIGLPKPPQAGENVGIDTRTWRQRRADFVNYDKHLERRKDLTRKMATPYFREWSNMRLHQGKSFLAPPGLFKKDRSLYFPNLHGDTLLKDQKPRDTTPVLHGLVSVVSVFSSQWAENQAATFASKEQNPEIHEVVKTSGGLAQIVHINIEENTLKAWIVKLFMPNLRRRFATEDWGRYFLVRRGLTDDTRDAIGLLNSKVGYTYLLDDECRIRWAASGLSEAHEKDGLVKGTRRLIEMVRARRNDKALAEARARVAEDSKVEKKQKTVA